MLLEHRAESCKPNNDDWLDNLDHLLTKYYKTETRSAIRLKALNVLEQIISTNKILHEVCPDIMSMLFLWDAYSSTEHSSPYPRKDA